MTAEVLAYVGLGSNLASPVRQLDTALGHLANDADTKIHTVSGLYRSSPLGGIEQPAFLNAAVSVLTRLDPRGLLDALQAIETTMGRDRSVRRWGPRNIDLDLLVHAAAEIDEPGLVVPHPGIASRNFVLLPLRDIDPELVVPGLGRIADLEIPPEPDIERVSDRRWHTSA